jgi:DNA topoisomerase IB
MASTLHVYVNKQHVAMIALPPKAADAYVPEEPWCLLHNTGRVDRFEKQAQARDEAMKTYGVVTFSKT